MSKHDRRTQQQQEISPWRTMHITGTMIQRQQRHFEIISIGSNAKKKNNLAGNYGAIRKGTSSTKRTIWRLDGSQTAMGTYQDCNRV
jgi:adenine-specific DNA methylase